MIAPTLAATVTRIDALVVLATHRAQVHLVDVEPLERFQALHSRKDKRRPKRKRHQSGSSVPAVADGGEKLWGKPAKNK